MKFILFFAAVFALSGPTAEPPRGFDTLENCEALRDKVIVSVGEYNASKNPDKIVTFAAACVPSKSAKQGKDV